MVASGELSSKAVVKIIVIYGNLGIAYSKSLCSVKPEVHLIKSFIHTLLYQDHNYNSQAGRQ